MKHMKTFFQLKLPFLFTVAVLLVSLRTASAQNWGSRTGCNQDGYVINSDQSYHWSFLRLNTGNGSGGNAAWSMLNQNGLTWNYSTSTDDGNLGTQLMKLTIDGKLGIGTITPHAQLHLANYSLNNRKIILWEDGINDHQFFGYGINDAALRYQVSTTYADHVFFAGTSNSSSNELMRIKGNGNVGIGTATPESNLVVAGSGTSRGLFKITSTTGNANDTWWLGFNHNGNSNDNNDRARIGVNILSGGAGRLFFTTGPCNSQVERMRIDENGNVGIGTANPNKGKLHIVGSFHVENAQGNQTFHVSADKQLVFVGDSAYVKYNASQASGVIQNNNFSLWVSKGIVTEDLAIVKVNKWSDHVFNKGYHLARLEEVETYINQHGHLPNIPSQKEVNEKGYNIQDLNAKFLEKIEELTLYTIEQQKEINILKKQNQTLKEETEKLQSLQATVKVLELKMKNLIK